MMMMLEPLTKWEVPSGDWVDIEFVYDVECDGSRAKAKAKHHQNGCATVGEFCSRESSVKGPHPGIC